MGRGELTYRKLVNLVAFLLSLLAFFSLWEATSFLLFIACFFLLILGFLNEYLNIFSVNRFILNLFAVIGTIVLLSPISLENLITPLSEALLLLITIKSLERKDVRDYYQILLLSFLAVSLATAVNISPLFLAIFMLELFLGIFFLIILNFYRNLKDERVNYEILRKISLLSVVFSVTVFFLSWIFFFFLPRLDKPLLDLFYRKEQGLISGISDSVEIGEVGEIQLDNTVAFRVLGIKIQEAPYWRVSVFDYYDGKKWLKVSRFPEREVKNVRGKSYTIILEPTYDTFLPLLDYPMVVLKVEGVKEKPIRFRGGYYEFRESVTRPIRILALSVDKAPTDPPLPIHKEVPSDLSPRIKELALELSKEAKNQEEKIKRVIEFFKKEGFEYSLKLEQYDGDPLEAFLFEKRRGNCEYYATATALILRLMGVPARLVSGFHGAIKNEYGNYYIVVNAMAHVWVEAYDGSKWVRVDTTPPYVPPGLEEISSLSLFYDALLTFWYKNVVDFSAEKQRDFFFRGLNFIRNFKEFFERNVGSIILFSVIFISLLGGLWVFERKRKTPDNLYREFLKRIKKYGIKEKSPERIIELFKDTPQYPYVKFIVQTYQRWKYSPYKDKEELKEAYKALKKL